MSTTLSINRAPVLTLWASVVAQRLGFDEDEALTLAKAVAGLNAQAKGRRLGIFKPHEEKAKKAREKERGERSAASPDDAPVVPVHGGRHVAGDGFHAGRLSSRLAVEPAMAGLARCWHVAGDFARLRGGDGRTDGDTPRVSVGGRIRAVVAGESTDCSSHSWDANDPGSVGVGCVCLSGA